MNNIEIAKQMYHHQDYKKALDLITLLITNREVSPKSVDYADILCYLGNCKLRLYEIFKNKNLLYDSLTDFITAENVNRICSHNTSSKSISKGIIICNNYYSQI